ncbi:hypothetical protein I4F81_011966 [Pyropia yezoensis]|uniref:Uncharacterized protein n=1 Tax=Pyropia yezoensis TaxID=2788 RepID=A0ACC3CH08_PYRYE|nr:hypothetical protein I4F81_011966 [Neopyropia yezoensis]
MATADRRTGNAVDADVRKGGHRRGAVELCMHSHCWLCAHRRVVYHVLSCGISAACWLGSRYVYSPWILVAGHGRAGRQTMLTLVHGAEWVASILAARHHRLTVDATIAWPRAPPQLPPVLWGEPGEEEQLPGAASPGWTLRGGFVVHPAGGAAHTQPRPVAPAPSLGGGSTLLQTGLDA